MSNKIIPHPSSYRDPAGFVFEKDGTYFRQVNKTYQKHYDLFINSGCYRNLSDRKLLISHEETDQINSDDAACYKIIKPEQINFISFPWEWSFEMMKDAALLTLHIARSVLEFGMTLKDATPFNIQWHKGSFIFIDTLSFETYNQDEPWIAYRQFCEAFLAPLLLMHHSKRSLQQLMLAWPDGIPLETAKALLPIKSKFSLHTYLHIHLHSKIVSKAAENKKSKSKFSKQKLLNLLTSLEILIKKLKSPDSKTTWSNYYDEASLRNNYLEEKKIIIKGYISQLTNIKTAIDLGANDGQFSFLLADNQIDIVAADADSVCVNHLYHSIIAKKNIHIQPLILDLSNPSPAVGFANNERASFSSRAKFDLIFSLALVHHLAIGKNISFKLISDFFVTIAPNLVIEFIPKEDEKVKLMLLHKKDIYFNYSETEFEKAFSKHYLVVSKREVGSSGRILYLMRRNEE